MKKISLFLAAIFIAALVHAQTVANFENLTLGPDTFWNGSDLSGGFSSGNAFFYNSYDTSFGGSWSGFSYSNKSDSTTPGLDNQYSAITASGFGGSGNYGVADEYGNAKIRLTGTGAGHSVAGLYVTNATYAYLSMLNGDQYAKKFGGATGNDPDWFKLTATGWFRGNALAQSVDFYLADYRFANNDSDYIVRTWQWMDLHTLGDVDSIQFFLSSTDNGMYGMNTPAYFCIDNFTTTDTLSHLPVAVNDYISITYLQDTLVNVLANDFSPVGDSLTVALISGPQISGAIAMDSANQIFYSPEIGVVATDTLVYAVCDTNNLCDTGMVIITINGLGTGISEVALQGVTVAPNPFASSFWIQHPADVEKITVYDMQGRVVKDIVCNNSVGKTEVNGEELPAGAYFIRLISESTSMVAKLIKQ